MLPVQSDDSLVLPPPPVLEAGAALFLDFDGTLVPLTDVPDAVQVDPDLHTLLDRLSDVLQGRLAIVSGRSIATLRDNFGLGHLRLAGTHGLEFAEPNEAPRTPLRLEEVNAAEARLHAFADDKPGLLVERKSISVGIHFRRAPHWGDACAALCAALASETGLFLQAGKMAFELRPGGADKGTALAALMESPAMRGGTPVFIGDDVTDEEGFVAATAHGGFGILVGELRATAAQWHLEQVAAVRHYLGESADRIG